MIWPFRKKDRVKKVELIQATIFELHRDKRYVIAFDENWLTPQERQAFSKIITNKGVKSITCVAGNGNPSDNMVVLEQKR